MRRRRRLVPSVVVVAMVAGSVASCGIRKTPLPASCQDGGCPPEVTSTWFFEQVSSSNIDVLFVIDDTPSLASRAEALAEGYRQLAQILGGPGTLPRDLVPSLHVAFVPGSRRSAADAAPLSRAASCGIVAPGQILTTDSCGRTPNTTGPFGDAFVCMAALGNASTGAFEPFEAARRALGSDGPAGFLRPNAYLIVVIVAGQDDMASSDAGSSNLVDFVVFLKRLKPDPNKVLVSAVGPPTACADAGTPATAPRLLEVVQAFGVNGVYAEACQDNALVVALQRVFILGHVNRSACLSRVFDTDPGVPGLQPDCIVEDRAWTDGVEAAEKTVLPACEHGAAPCWTMRRIDACKRDDVQFEVDRGPDWCFQDRSSTVITCRVCPSANDPACRSF